MTKTNSFVCRRFGVKFLIFVQKSLGLELLLLSSLLLFIIQWLAKPLSYARVSSNLIAIANEEASPS